MPIYYPPSTSGLSGGDATISGSFSLTGDISPVQITSNQNNYAPSGHAGASVFRLTSDAARNLTGLAGASDGRFVLLKNIGSNNIVLKNEDAASTATNRFTFLDPGPTGADRTIFPGRSILLYYDATSGRWNDAYSPSKTSAGTIQAGLDDEKYVTALAMALSQLPQDLIDGPTVAWNFASGYNAKLVLGGNRTFDVPSNYRRGGVYVLELTQDGTGSRTVAWNACYDWGIALAPTLSTGINKMDLVTLYCYDAVTPKFRCSVNKAS